MYMNIFIISFYLDRIAFARDIIIDSKIKYGIQISSRVSLLNEYCRFDKQQIFLYTHSGGSWILR